MSQSLPLRPSEYPAPRPLWSVLPLAVAALLACIALFGCVTPDGQFDAPATAQELELTAADLETLAVVADVEGKAGTARALRDASAALASAAQALQAGTGGSDAWDALDFAMRELAAVAAANEDSDLALGVAAAQIVVRRIRAQVESPEPAESPPSK